MSAADRAKRVKQMDARDWTKHLTKVTGGGAPRIKGRYRDGDEYRTVDLATPN